jgi:hypothetical protein
VTIDIDQDAWILARPKRFTVEKADGYRNEDASALSPRRGVLSALSDGASVSFDSATWANILVEQYARNPEFDRAWLNEAIAKFAKLYDRENLPWMQQASFDRGSFASLLGVRQVGGALYVLAIGDSLAVLCDGDEIVSSIPYTSPIEFEQRPQLLSTNAADNDFIEDVEPARWYLRDFDSPALLCMTDALGQWALAYREEEPSPISRLRRIKSLPAFKRLVAAERESGRLRRDDTTLLAYWRFQRG